MTALGLTLATLGGVLIGASAGFVVGAYWVAMMRDQADRYDREGFEQ